MKGQSGSRARRVLAFSAAAVLLSVVACAARVQDKAQKADIAPSELTSHSARHLHGPLNVVVSAARAHGRLTAAQKQHVAAIESELRPDKANRRAMHEKLRSSAAAVVRAGTADSATFDKSVDKAVRVFKQRADAYANALEELHAILTPDQRQAVAAALLARIDQRYGHRHHGHHHHFRRLASYLMLSQQQVAQLKAMKKQLFGQKKRLRPSRAELVKLVDAFKGDDFDSALEAFRADKLAILRDRVAHAGQRTDTLLAIFTPEQRDLLADLILEGPEKVLLGAKQGATAGTSATAR